MLYSRECKRNCGGRRTHLRTLIRELVSLVSSKSNDRSELNLFQFQARPSYAMAKGGPFSNEKWSPTFWLDQIMRQCTFKNKVESEHRTYQQLFFISSRHEVLRLSLLFSFVSVILGPSLSLAAGGNSLQSASPFSIKNLVFLWKLFDQNLGISFIVEIILN